MSGWWLVSYVVLWLVVIGLGVVVLVFIRQLGLVYERLGSQSTGGHVAHEGPEVGATIGVLKLPDARDPQRLVEIPSDDAPRSLLLFVSTECSLCERAVRDAAEVIGSRDDTALVILARAAADDMLALAPDAAWAVDAGISGSH